MTDRELIQMALDALDSALSDNRPYISACMEAHVALLARLEQCDAGEICLGCRACPDTQPEPEQKPAAWEIYSVPPPLYPAPPQREWQGLTTDEIYTVWDHRTGAPVDFARAIEAKLKERNS